MKMNEYIISKKWVFEKQIFKAIMLKMNFLKNFMT
jgi:hypothetical protein